ncbi:MAG: (Na+)-NQR maturation NqrM [Planctomycetota bacterium]
MTTFLIAAGVFAVALAGMAVGVIVSNRRIKGSCGGLNNFRDSVGNPICDACTKPSPECTGNPAERDAVTN